MILEKTKYAKIRWLHVVQLWAAKLNTFAFKLGPIWEAKSGIAWSILKTSHQNCIMRTRIYMMTITFDLKCSTFTVKCSCRKWPVFVMDNWNVLHICETFRSILSLKSFMFVVQRIFQLSCSSELGLLNRTNNTDVSLLLHIWQTRNSCQVNVFLIWVKIGSCQLQLWQLCWFSAKGRS